MGPPRDSDGTAERNWQDSPQWGTALLIGYVALALIPVTLALALTPSTGDAFLTELGKGAGLTGFALLALQVALSARLKSVDRPFGLDVVVRFHKGMAILACVLLALHPVLLAAGRGSFHLFSFGTSWRVNLGKIALVLLLAVVLVALLLKRLRIPYQPWRLAHKGAVVVVVLGFTHGLVIGDDLHHPAARAYWWLLLAMAAGIFAYRNIFVPLWGRRRFLVTGVRGETHNTHTITLEPEGGRPLRHTPGQFMFLKLLRPGLPSEEHPFTISSSPTQQAALTATIKESGDFTNTIGQTRPGDGARIEGPYGRFSLVHHHAPAFLFIAGGVGITPIMSMLRYLRDTGDGRLATLVYGNRTEGDILFRDELAAMPDTVAVVHVLSEPAPGWDGPSGYVIKETIQTAARERQADAHVYLCGPPPMMDKVIPALRALGVEDARIHYERFAL